MFCVLLFLLLQSAGVEATFVSRVVNNPYIRKQPASGSLEVVRVPTGNQSMATWNLEHRAQSTRYSVVDREVPDTGL